MNIFLKALILIGKLLVIAFIVLFFYVLGFGLDITHIIEAVIMSIILFGTVFVFFLKNRALTKFPNLKLLWRAVIVVYLIVLVGYAALLSFGFYREQEKSKTQQAIDQINSRKIDLSDVMGTNLPPVPDQKLNDSTIAGIDANNNGIRDDVELAIFAKYPNSAKIRAAELQYAQALQLELTRAYDSKIIIKVIGKTASATTCIDDVAPSTSGSLQKEVENLALNTDMRREKKLDDLHKYTNTYSNEEIITYLMLSIEQRCDIDTSLLTN